MPVKKSANFEKRALQRQQWWANENAWLGTQEEKGWFGVPRTLPLILQLLDSKEVSENMTPSRVYVDLFSRHMDNGIVEITNENDCAFSSGYTGTRALRTWQERMKVLEETGFIKTKKIGNQNYGLVLLVHPVYAVQRLRDAGKVPDNWWAAYCTRQAETKEATYDQREKAKAPSNVIPITQAKTVSPSAMPQGQQATG